MPSLLSLSLPPRCRIRIRHVGDHHRVTISIRSGDAEDASASLSSTDFVSVGAALEAIHSTVVTSFLAGEVVR